MTAYLQGSTATLDVQWSQYAGGPAADVTGLTITITRVAGGVVIVATTSTGITRLATGLYAYVWAVASGAVLGDYSVVWATGDGRQAPDIVTVVASTVTVTVDDVVDYLDTSTAALYEVSVGDDDDAVTYPQIADALATETRAQRQRVTYPTSDTDGLADLAEALKRRVQRNLAMRLLPLSMQVGEGGMVARPSRSDPEVARLEAPYRRLPTG